MCGSRLRNHAFASLLPPGRTCLSIHPESAGATVSSRRSLWRVGGSRTPRHRAPFLCRSLATWVGAAAHCVCACARDSVIRHDKHEGGVACEPVHSLLASVTHTHTHTHTHAHTLTAWLARRGRGVQASALACTGMAASVNAGRRDATGWLQLVLVSEVW